MAINFVTHINLSKNELQNAVVQNLTSAPTSPSEGQIYWNSTANTLNIYNGSAWVNLAEGDITAVVAGNGLTGGGTSGSVTLNVVGGDGITANADEIEVTVDGTTIELSATNGTGAVRAKTAAVSDGGENLATGGQIYSFVTDFNYLQGNQTITLSGDVTGSGTTAITTTIAANAVEGSMLNNNVISGQTALTTGLASTDELMVSDAGTLKRMDVSVLQSYMQSNLTFTTNTDTDVSVSNLETRLGQIDTSVTIGNGSSVNTSTSGNLTVGGNLIVEGTTTTVNSTTVAIDDHHFKVATDNAGTNDFGFYGRYNSTAGFAGLFFDVSAAQWVFYANNSTEPGNTTFTPDEIATIKAQFVGDVTGNASTASSAAKWTTARTITLGGDLTGNVSIDGSANATLTATIAANSVALGTDTTGNYVATLANASSGGLTVSSSGTESAAVTVGLDYAGADNFILSSASEATTVEDGEYFVISNASNNVQYITKSNFATALGAMSGFFLEDGDGTEVTITDGKEVKFVEGGGIDINWTDTSPGSDADPYDLTFTVNTATAAQVQAGTVSSHFVTPDTLAAKSVHATIDVSDTNFASNLYAEITHNLGTEDVIVQCFDSSTKETVFADVARTDKANTASTSKVKISFGAAPSNDIEVMITSIKGSTVATPVYA